MRYTIVQCQVMNYLALPLDRIRKIIESSKSRQYSIHINLEKALCDDEKFTINCHRDCMSSYTSSYHIKVGATSRGVARPT